MTNGTGPGPVTPDGCAVEVYRRLPTAGEPELVHAVAGAGASVLDLGCGVGRIADPLVGLGHPVVAVDESAEMLAELRLAEPVRSRIEDLDLGRRFDLVLLASRLANTPGRAERSALFGSCRRHLRPGGKLMLEWSTPEWFDQIVERGGSTGRLEPFELELVVHGVQHRPPDGPVLAATISYRAADLTWTQTFRTERLTREQLTDELAGHGLVGLRPAAGDSWWLLATATPDPSAVQPRERGDDAG